VVLCVGAIGGGPLRRLFENEKLRRVRLQMAEAESLGRPLTTAAADGNSLRYYPVFRDSAARLLEPQDPALSRLGMQLLCQQRLDRGPTLGDTHERDEPFDFDLPDESLALIEQLAQGVIGSPFPRIRRRWVGGVRGACGVSDSSITGASWRQVSSPRRERAVVA